MKEGDIVNYDFEVYADDTLIDTSIEELAKKQEIFSEEKTYGPKYIIVGTDGPYKGIKDALETAEEGGEAEVVLKPGEGFSKKNPSLVKYFRYSDVAYWANLQEKNVERGEKIDINGKEGIINLVTPARVRVDFNPEHAGKTLKVKVKVNSVVTGKDEILRAIIEMNMGTSEGFEFNEEDDVLNIKVPSGIGLTEDWLTAKLMVVTQIRRHTGIKNIRYIEEFFQKASLTSTTTTTTQEEGEEPSTDEGKPAEGEVKEFKEEVEGEGTPGEERPEEKAPEEPPEETAGETDEQPSSPQEAGSDVAVMERKEE